MNDNEIKRIIPLTNGIITLLFLQFSSIFFSCAVISVVIDPAPTENTAKKNTEKEINNWHPQSCPITDTLIDSLGCMNYSGLGIREIFHDTFSSDLRFYRSKDTLFIIRQTYMSKMSRDPIPAFSLCKDTLAVFYIYSDAHELIAFSMPEYYYSVYIFRIRKECDLIIEMPILNSYKRFIINTYETRDKLPSDFWRKSN